MNNKALITLFLIIILTGCSSGPNMKEGKWEITTEMGLKGIPIKMPALSHTQCLTKDNLIPKDEQQKDSSCTVSEQEIDGDTVSWTVACNEGATSTTSQGSITYSGVLFSGIIEISMSGGPMSMNASNTITGKYLGPCN